MTITEYYENYKHNKKYPIKLGSNTDKTIDDFYCNCISANLLPKLNVIAWHKMLMKYVMRLDAIFWVREYENGSIAGGRYNTRRACMTTFKDGFSYVFVSNYDAHEIFNMIRLGVTPDAEEFAELMKNHKYPMHYATGNSCEEFDIKSFPNIGTVKGGILTSEHWYLAHINGIKSDFIRPDGTHMKVDVDKAIRIYPRGVLTDWKLDESENMVRKLDYSLSDDEKDLVKAHFLRFVDPLNYYVVPGPKYESNSIGSKIGEYDKLNLYISEKYEQLYDKCNMDVFRKKALIKKQEINPCGSDIVNVTYGTRTAKASLSVSVKKPMKPLKKAKSHASRSNAGIGQYAKVIFTNLLNTGKLSSSQLSNLSDKVYCSKNFRISYSIIVEDIPGTYDPQKYYKKHVVLGKYLICSQWYERSRSLIEDWLTVNLFEEVKL